MRRLTLDETWTECLKMWRWIVREIRKGRRGVGNLKGEYLKKRGIPADELMGDCFFCDYPRPERGYCRECPGRLVSSRFQCERPSYCYYSHPSAFLRKIEALYLIYKKGKK